MTTETPEKKSGGSLWSRLSPLYKKRFMQGVLAYVLVVALVGGWIWLKADNTREHWNSRIPRANAPVLAVDIQEVIPAPAQHPDPLPPEIAGVTPVNGNQPAIALIVSGVGISEQMTKQALDILPPEVALAYSPYTNIASLESFTQTGMAAKRDNLLLLPMEPVTYPKDDPGPKALLSRASAKQNTEYLNWLLSRTANISGVMNYMGSRFLTDSNNLRPVFNAINKNKLFFIENSGNSNYRLAETTARIAQTPYMAVDVTLDSILSEHEIRLQLVALEKRAAERGYAIGVLRPYPVSLQTVDGWADTLARRGFRLIAPSTLWQESKKNDTDGQNGSDPNP
jgi:polysaccharide deacetylase 2 family uncharacterized protein YibQ